MLITCLQVFILTNEKSSVNLLKFFLFCLILMFIFPVMYMGKDWIFIICEDWCSQCKDLVFSLNLEKTDFSQFGRLGNVCSGCQHIFISGEILLPGSQTGSACCVLTWTKGRGGSLEALL